VKRRKRERERLVRPRRPLTATEIEKNGENGRGPAISGPRPFSREKERGREGEEAEEFIGSPRPPWNPPHDRGGVK